MKMKVLNIYILFLYFGFGKSQQFIVDQNCVGKLPRPEFGASLQIDFYIPHNWVNNEHDLNYLRIRTYPKHIVLRHPSSTKKDPNEINLPLNEMRIGWNTIYLRKEGNNLEISVKTGDESSPKIIQNVSLSEEFVFVPSEIDPFQPDYVTGLSSVVNCKGPFRYYNIAADSNVTVPFVLFNTTYKFEAYSRFYPFSFKIYLTGHKKKICTDGENTTSQFTIERRKCKYSSVSLFSQNIVYNFYVPRKTFDPKGILIDNSFTFSELVFQNTGHNNFYIKIEVVPPSNAPISMLKVPADTPPIPPAEPPAEPHASDVTSTESPLIVSVSPGNKGCGINTKMILSDRISGGTTTKPNDWPWMAALVENGGFGESETHLCGGVLITDKHVLTSANCFSGVNKEAIKVRLGEFDFNTYDEHHVDFTIAEVKTPDNFVPDENEHDIAIIKLNGSAGEMFQPVCLPPPNQDWEGQYGFLTGWGKVFFFGPQSNHLREVIVQIWKQSECDAAYSRSSVTNNMICAGSRGEKGSCEGDTGGPLMVQILPETQWYVVGIDSWGIGCGINNLPTVYTKVDQYLDWITKNTAV